MDMKIDAQKIISLRQSKAWSQQHVADVSGLSLRTVQRIEKTQAASQESVKALSAAFNVKPEDLFINTGTHSASPAAHSQNTMKFGIIALLIVSILFFAYWSKTVVATAPDNNSALPQVIAYEDHASIVDAEKWLAIVDNMDYEKSWEESDPHFQHQVSKTKWNEAMITVRQPFGNALNRVHSGTQSMNTLPGLPDGNYVTLSFSTQFENKAAAVETLVLNGNNGEWKTLGYFIR